MAVNLHDRGRRLNLTQLSEMLNNGDLKRAPKLTPRSRAACRRVGVLPLELMLRESESFAETGLDEDIKRMRHEAYVHERRTQLELAQAERTSFISEQDKEAMRSKVAASNGDEDQSATFLEQEQRRLVKIQRRQQREIEQMLEYEMKVTKIQQEATEKTEREAERVAAAERMKKQRMKAVAEERRQRELRRVQQKEEAERQRRLVEKKAFLKEKALAERAIRMEEKATRETRRREVERQAKAEEHRRAQEAALAKTQAEIEARFEEMQRAEAERERVMQAQHEQRAREVKKKRRLIEARIRANSSQYAIIEEKQRTDYLRKQAAMKERQYRRSEELEIQHEEKIRLSQLNERRRQLAIEEAHRESRGRIDTLLAHQKKTFAVVDRVRFEEQKKRGLKKERMKLVRAARHAAVMRQRRMAEHHKQVTLKKLKEDEARTLAMLAKKEEIIEKRKRAGIRAKLQRDRIVDVMAQVRLTKKWDQATTKVAQVMSDVPRHLATEVDVPKSKTPSPKRKSARRKAKRAAASRDERLLPLLEKNHARAVKKAGGLASQLASEDARASAATESLDYQSPYDAEQILVSPMSLAKSGRAKQAPPI